MHPENNLNFWIIGSCKSAALINENGSIDWCCLPEFDSSSVFAKILDDNKGGGFWINSKNKFETKQMQCDINLFLIRTHTEAAMIYAIPPTL